MITQPSKAHTTLNAVQQQAITIPDQAVGDLVTARWTVIKPVIDQVQIFWR